MTPRPAPKRISAIPPASASFRTTQARPIACEKRASACTPIQLGSMFAAVITRPPTIAPGTPMPIGPESGPRRATTSAVAATTASVSAG